MQRSSSEASFSLHYSQPGTKGKMMGRKRTTLSTDSSAAVCIGFQTKSFDSTDHGAILSIQAVGK